MREEYMEMLRIVDIRLEFIYEEALSNKKLNNEYMELRVMQTALLKLLKLEYGK